MSEFDHQKALIDWARLPTIQAKYPGIDLLHASLNGVKLTPAQAGKAKASGMLAGVYDLCLPVARGIFHGCYLELKYGKNRLTKDQVWFGNRLASEGWYTACCWSWTEAQELLIDYLSQGAFHAPA
jgi:hypothetical protein